MIILRYILSTIYYLVYGLLLLIFHIFQWLGLNLFGYEGHRRVVDVMNYCLVKSLWIIGGRFEFDNPHEIPTNKPIIFVANHQSLYDISAMASYFWKNHVKFVSKKELGKGLPSISYNLRNGGSVLIDRKNRTEALKSIITFAKYLETNSRSTVIFPEGTRSKDGNPKMFKKGGLQTILKYCPSAVIVPISINNSYKLVKDGPFPLNIGIKIRFTVHKPIANGSMPIDKLFETIEQVIVSGIDQPK